MLSTSTERRGSRYLDEGSGEVIVLLYGLFGSTRNFSHLTSHLSNKFRVIIPIFPFYDRGNSVTIFTLTDYVTEIVTELHLVKFHLLGNSMGGHIAILYTLLHPEKIESLILSGSSGLFENGMGDSFPKRKEFEYIKSKTEMTFYNPSTATREMVNEIYEIVNSRKAIQILSLAKSTIRNNLEKELHQIKAPCCLIWGRQDIVTPPQVAVDFKRLIPHAKLYWIEQCGHVPMLETPDQFNALIDHFLDTSVPRPGILMNSMGC